MIEDHDFWHDNKQAHRLKVFAEIKRSSEESMLESNIHSKIIIECDIPNRYDIMFTKERNLRLPFMTLKKKVFSVRYRDCSVN